LAEGQQQKQISITTNSGGWAWASAEIFPGEGQHRNFAYPFQVADDAMQMDVQKTLHPFYPISLYWLNLNYQSFF